MDELRFSRRTVIAAAEMMEEKFSTHAALTRYLLKLDRQLAARCDAGVLADRFNHLIKFFDEDPGRHLDDGELLWDKFVETAVSLLRPPPEFDDWLMGEDKSEAKAQTPEAVFRRALELDGFTVSGNTLHRALPVDVGLPAAQSEVDRLLEKHGLTTPKGHLKQALDAHGRGDWAAANSQIRAFFDALLDDIAGKLDPSAATLSSGQPRRAKPAAIGFLSRDLNEWADNGTGFVNGLVRRLHPQGAHPGLSDQEDSTFRLHVILLTARVLLTRFDAQVTA
jgi:hypothetical protein